MSVGRRFISRFNPGRPPILEEIVQCLYHQIEVATTPAEQQFFAQIGQGLTPLNITPQLSASNGQIPDPKIFAIHGIRLYHGNRLVGGQTDETRTEDLIILLETMFFQLFIGEKFYLTVPAFYLPSGGLGPNAYFDGETAGTPRHVANSGFGGFFDRFSTQRIPITIPSRQLFFARHAPGITPTVNIVSARQVWCIMDGAFGREVA